MVSDTFVTKRDGTLEKVSADKLSRRIQNLSSKFSLKDVKPKTVVNKIVAGLVDGISTREIDNLSAIVATGLAFHYPKYGKIASGIVVSKLHKETSLPYPQRLKKLLEADAITEVFYDTICLHWRRIEAAIEYEKDYEYSYTALKTLCDTELLEIGGEVLERPQERLIRIAFTIFPNNVKKAIAHYRLLSNKCISNATPTAYNAGRKDGNYSSCFLATFSGSSVKDVAPVIADITVTTESLGGIGLSISEWYATGSKLKSGNISGGIPLLCEHLNSTKTFSQQSGSTRRGGFGVYLEPWHADIEAFLNLKKKGKDGESDRRARKIHFGLWMPDLFMKRLERGENWSLFCPSQAPGLCDVWGEEFEALYCKYEREGKAKEVVNANELMKKICCVGIETGGPYMLYKDACNRYSNQSHLGTIRSSNLCTEIIEYSAPGETAVCNLTSISVPAFVKNGDIDYDRLYQTAKHITYSLNDLIDLTNYPTEAARKSNNKNRPIGIGIQGLADAFMMLDLPYDCEQARVISREVQVAIYYGFCEASCELSERDGPCEGHAGSFLSKGIFNFEHYPFAVYDKRWDFGSLRKRVVQYGMRNTLGVANMPTAKSSGILDNNEGFEPFNSNMYVKSAGVCSSVEVNKHLVAKLESLGLWNEDTCQAILAADGSVANIPSIPNDVKAVYRTVWEIPMKHMIEMARDRMPFIDQSQSFNCFMAEPTPSKLASYHLYCWKMGLKTGMYYLRTKSTTNTPKNALVNKQEAVDESAMSCGINGMCGS